MQNQQLPVNQLSSDKHILESICNCCQEKKELKYLCACKNASYCSTYNQKKTQFAHKNRCPNDDELQKEEIKLKLTQKSKTGLRNLGSTSYMNSALQCISHIKQLTDYFLKNKYIEEINKENRLGTKGQLSTAYAKLIQNLWFGTEPSFAPVQLKNTIVKYQPMFSGFNQHDSSELISFLLDGLHEDLNRIKQKPYVESKDYDNRPDKVVADEAWFNFTKRNQSIIVDLVYGQFKLVMDCPKCKYRSVEFDPFMMVSLPIHDEKTKTIEQQISQKYYHQKQPTNLQIEDCLSMFQQAEMLGEYEAWYCPKCKQFVEAKKQTQIYRAPKVLILCLKKSKSYYNSLVNYPVIGLDLSKYAINHELPNLAFHAQGNKIFRKPVYDLIAVSNRLGNSDGGHYTAYCKDTITQQWLQFNDSYVSEVKQISNVVSATALVQFYRRRE